MIKYVTLTGADDSVSPLDLVRISYRFPFVEWGILFSKSKSGAERYPSPRWVDRLKDIASLDYKINFSAHLCGGWCDDVLNGNFSFLRSKCSPIFKRIQLNLGRDRLRQALNNQVFLNTVKDSLRPIIVGGDYKYVSITDGFFSGPLIPLFDASGGRGFEESDWPKPFIDNKGSPILCGFAGGLGPDNIVSEIPRIASTEDMEFWVDMETKLRTNNKFDLAKCEEVLSAIKPMV